MNPAPVTGGFFLVMAVSIIKKKVAPYLLKSDKAQADDLYLIGRMWHDEMIASGHFTSDEAVKFCKFIADGNVTPPEAISRSRRKLQEEDPIMYGVNHNRRKNESKIRQQLKQQ